MDLAELVVGIIPILIIGYLIRLIKYKFKDLEKTSLVKIQIIIHIVLLVLCILSCIPLIIFPLIAFFS